MRNAAIQRWQEHGRLSWPCAPRRCSASSPWATAFPAPSSSLTCVSLPPVLLCASAAETMTSEPPPRLAFALFVCATSSCGSSAFLLTLGHPFFRWLLPAAAFHRTMAGLATTPRSSHSTPPCRTPAVRRWQQSVSRASSPWRAPRSAAACK